MAQELPSGWLTHPAQPKMTDICLAGQRLKGKILWNISRIDNTMTTSIFSSSHPYSQNEIKGKQISQWLPASKMSVTSYPTSERHTAQIPWNRLLPLLSRHAWNCHLLCRVLPAFSQLLVQPTGRSQNVLK